MRQIFVNLPVKDLERSKRFFQSLGFAINPQFSDDKAACVVVEEGSIHVMLLTEPFFKTFLPSRSIADANKSTEVLLCLSCSSDDEVSQP
jgi:predicted lactoylglutathione lyase